jgi:hypothetical protein
MKGYFNFFSAISIAILAGCASRNFNSGESRNKSIVSTVSIVTLSPDFARESKLNSIGCFSLAKMSEKSVFSGQREHEPTWSSRNAPDENMNKDALVKNREYFKDKVRELVVLGYSRVSCENKMEPESEPLLWSVLNGEHGEVTYANEAGSEESIRFGILPAITNSPEGITADLLWVQTRKNSSIRFKENGFFSKGMFLNSSKMVSVTNLNKKGVVKIGELKSNLNGGWQIESLCTGEFSELCDLGIHNGMFGKIELKSKGLDALSSNVEPWIQLQ